MHFSRKDNTPECRNVQPDAMSEAFLQMAGMFG